MANELFLVCGAMASPPVAVQGTSGANQVTADGRVWLFPDAFGVARGGFLCVDAAGNVGGRGTFQSGGTPPSGENLITIGCAKATAVGVGIIAPGSAQTYGDSQSGFSRIALIGGGLQCVDENGGVSNTCYAVGSSCADTNNPYSVQPITQSLTSGFYDAFSLITGVFVFVISATALLLLAVRFVKRSTK